MTIRKILCMAAALCLLWTAAAADGYGYNYNYGAPVNLMQYSAVPYHWEIQPRNSGDEMTWRVQNLLDGVRSSAMEHTCWNNESLDDFQPNAANVIAWTRRLLSEEDEKWLHDLPLSIVMPGITLVHGTLDMPERWGYVFDLLDAEAHFSYQTTPICFHGHTHVPVIFDRHGTAVDRTDPPKSGERIKAAFGRRYFINVGSVGQPRDGDPRSSYVLFRPKTREIEFRRVPYDVETAADKVRKAGLPERLAVRLLFGR